MLYRNPDVPVRVSLIALALRAIRRKGAARRRRRADLDLMALSGHLKRDLGVDGFGRFLR